jgi:hypothetical protein
MTVVQVLLGASGTLALCGALAGVIARERYREWWSFSLYLSLVSVYGLLIAVSPGRYRTPNLWMANENISNLARFGMALELAYRTFRGFPGAMARVRAVSLGVIGVTLVVVLAATPPQLDYRTFVGQVQPRVLNGSVWLFTAIGALILWYRLPVRPFHKRVLLSYLPYLLIFTVAMNALGALGWERGRLVSYFNQIAYLTLAVFWAWAAWQPVEPDRRPLNQSAPAVVQP